MRVLLLLLILPFTVFAQDPPNTTVTYNGKLKELMELYTSYNKKFGKADGYRVQIMFSNDKGEAYNNKARIYKEFPGVACYVDYEQPYYKLKVGDYANRFEAYNMLQKILPVFPGAFIVRDKIAVTQ